jgi:ComF family protein
VCGQPRQSVAGGYAGVDEICGQCLQRKPHYDRARSRWEYSGTVAEALQQAKYHGRIWVLRSLADELRPWLVDQIERCDDNTAALLCAVPMHPRDLRRRGFNAALLLARLALPQMCVVPDLVIKTRQTPAQAGLARGQRMVNLRGAFECRQPERVEHKTVVVFDDVMTTGATTGEVAKVLKRAGANAVIVVTAARAIAY